MKPIVSNTRLLLFVFLVLILASCATPQAIVRMNPVTSDVRWNYGQAFAADTVMGIMVESAFDKATKEFNVFDVSIVNGSNMNYLVDPSNFQIIDVESPTDQPTVYHAIDPESMILSIDKQQSQAVADEKNTNVGAGIALGALAVAAVAVAIADDSPAHYDTRSYEPNLFFAAPVVMEVVSSDVPYNYVSTEDQQRDMWVTSTVRKTTLAPGYRIVGKIFFPRFEKPGVYILKLKVDNETLEIPFTQLNFYP